MKKVAIHTLGCKINFCEASMMKNQLQSAGYKIVPFKEQADIYIVNTCTVTSSADAKSRHYLRRAKRQNPASLVVATGCLVQVYPEHLEKMSEVDLLVRNEGKEKILAFVEGKQVSQGIKHCRKNLTYTYRDRARAFVKVQSGCEFDCSYCIIPKARGRMKSMKPEHILKEIKELEQSGYKEVVLTGTQLGFYGKDLKEKINLPALIKKILKSTKIRRLRLSSIEPMAFDDELLETVALNERIAPHLHIPLQSGSNKILKLMNRKYTVQDFVRLIENIKDARKDTCIGTDVIAGFPGEDEDDFGNTFELLESLPISYIHVFPFSPRKKTKAYNMKHQCSPVEKKRRVKALIDLSKKKNLLYRKEFKGKVREGIVIDSRTVLTDNYIKVKINKMQYNCAENIFVEITE